MLSSSFPKFTDGDVKIAVFPQIYYLHSSVLATNSGFLRQLLEGHQAPQTPAISPRSQHNRPSCSLSVNLIGSSAHKYGMLEIQCYDGPDGALDDMDTCSFPEWPQKTRHIWSNIFKTFYNLTPILNTDGYDSILGNCQGLVELAEELQSVDVVSPAISTALLDFDQELYRLIAVDPISWIKLGVRIQSGPIFKESMIHLVGKWGYLDEKDRDSLPMNIRTLCTQKIRSLTATKEAVERQIVNKLPRPRSDGTRHRETKNVFGWMALTFYQQWLCQSFATNRNHHAPDGGAAFYRAIAAGGDAYLNKLDQDIAQVHASLDANPEGNKGLKELEKDLNELKKGMKGFVTDLLVNEAKYSPTTLGALPYLTCCKVNEDELPQSEIAAPEMGLQFRGIGNTINTALLNNNQLHQHFLPAGLMMNYNGAGGTMGLDNSLGNNYLMDPGLQDSNHNSNHSTPFNPFNNTLNQQTTDALRSWDNAAADFPNSASPFSTEMPPIGPMQPIPLPELPNAIYHPQPRTQAQAQFNTGTDLGDDMGMDFLDEQFLPEGDRFVHNGGDGSMAFL